MCICRIKDSGTMSSEFFLRQRAGQKGNPTPSLSAILLWVCGGGGPAGIDAATSSSSNSGSGGWILSATNNNYCIRFSIMLTL